MSRGKRLEIELKPRDRQQVEKLLGGGLQAVRTTLRVLSWQGSRSGSAGAAAHYRRGLLAAARGAGTLDGAAFDRRSYQAQTCSSRGQRDHPDFAGKP